MTNILFFILIGIAAGVLSGLFGIGVGVIIVPALVYLCGFTQLKAQGTSLAILLPPVGAVAFMEYYKKGFVDLESGLLICIFLVFGSIIGGKLAPNIPSDTLKRGFGVIMLLIALKMIMGK